MRFIGNCGSRTCAHVPQGLHVAHVLAAIVGLGIGAAGANHSQRDLLKGWFFFSSPSSQSGGGT